jgi:hypothetical protein
MQVMAWRDGEAESNDSSSVEHLLSCDACRHWQQQMDSLGERLGTLEYVSQGDDLWRRIQTQIREEGKQALRLETLWAVGGIVLFVRALQLFVDLPLPWLHPLVAVAAAALAVWRFGGDFVAIATVAPELQKRGI